MTHLIASGVQVVCAGSRQTTSRATARLDVDGAADGFNLMPPLLPESLDGFIDEVIPVLQRRGLFRTAYTAGTLRGDLGLERPMMSPGR